MVTDLGDLSADGAFHSHVESAITSTVNDSLARYEQIKKFTILKDDFTQEAGELTPTQKLKRNVIVDHHHEVIEEMYPSA